MPFSAIVRNVLAAGVSFIGATVWTKLLSHCVYTRSCSPHVARKVIHITTAPLFVFTWPLYSRQLYPSLFAATTPLYFAIRIFLNPFSDSLVRAVARVKQQQHDAQPSDSNPPGASERQSETRALASGPMTYGLSIGLLTLLGWRENPATYTAMAALCFGDGMADVVGSKLNMLEIPLPKKMFSKKKSFPGTLAFLLSMTITTFTWLRLPFFVAPHINPASFPIGRIAAVAGASAVTELFPFEDNLTVPLVAYTLTQMLKT